jgi:hypothetical protein
MLRASAKVFALGAVTLAAFFILSPRAKADIIEVEGTGSNACASGGSLGGGLCNGTQAFNLSSLLVQLSVPNSIGSGTQKYVVFNDIGNQFTFTITSIGQNNTGVADNAQCQINGGATSFFNACSITGGNGATTSLGTTQINGLTFPATINFNGTAGAGATFILGFVSMQGTSSALTVPEPSTLASLGSGMLFLLGLGLVSGLRRRPTTARSAA